jgi:hypothetical protein
LACLLQSSVLGVWVGGSMARIGAASAFCLDWRELGAQVGLVRFEVSGAWRTWAKLWRVARIVEQLFGCWRIACEFLGACVGTWLALAQLWRAVCIGASLSVWLGALPGLRRVACIGAAFGCCSDLCELGARLAGWADA